MSIKPNAMDGANDDTSNPADEGETYWLVERQIDGRPHWLDHLHCQWQPDASRATRYTQEVARREAKVQRVWHRDESIAATEHMDFPAPPPTPEEREQPTKVEGEVLCGEWGTRSVSLVEAVERVESWIRDPATAIPYRRDVRQIITALNGAEADTRLLAAERQKFQAAWAQREDYLDYPLRLMETITGREYHDDSSSMEEQFNDAREEANENRNKARMCEAMAELRSAALVRAVTAEAALAAARADLKELRQFGGMLANCAFNLKQRDRLTERERQSLDESQRAWDDVVTKQVTAERRLEAAEARAEKQLPKKEAPNG